MKATLLLALAIFAAPLLPAGCVMTTAMVGAAVSTSTRTACATDAMLEFRCPDHLSGPTETARQASGPAPDHESALAVAAALVAVGREGRYVAEGNGPVDFDCSGLTAYAWRQAGVNLVDYSYTQRAQTQDIPRSAVQPGDLVFWFGGSEHHVAIVTAVNGSQITIAEAANPEAGIRTRLLGGSWDDSYLTGFGRVIRP